jgi:AraC-like DNA-binding protein
LRSSLPRVEPVTIIDREPAIFSWIDLLLKDGTAIAPNTMSANLAARILRAAVAEGGDRRTLLAAAGLDETRLRNPFSRISASAAIHFFKILQSHFNDPAVHLRLGETAAMQNFSDFGFATRLETDLGSVIDAHIQLQALRQTMVKTRFSSSGKPPFFLWDCPPERTYEYASFVEFSVATYARLSRHVLGEMPLLQSVHFQHHPQFAVSRYEAVFGCAVQFGMPATRMEIAGRQVFRPSPFANRALLEAAVARYQRPAQWMVQGKTQLALGYFYLTSELDKSPPTLDRLAASFGMSERSLRRKLLEEGMSFRDLLDLVRNDMCHVYFMENTRSLGQIAFLLGYSELSAFTRAYKRWHGTAPSRREG